VLTLVRNKAPRHAVLTTATGEWLASRLGRFTPEGRKPVYSGQEDCWASVPVLGVAAKGKILPF